MSRRAILQVAGSLKEQIHRRDLNDVEDVIVVPRLVCSKAGGLNSESCDSDNDSCNNPFSSFAVNIGRVDSRCEKGYRRSNRQ